MKMSTRSTEKKGEIPENVTEKPKTGGKIQREATYHDRMVHQRQTRVGCYNAGGTRRALTELVKLAGNLDGKQILEFGCGHGWITVDLAQPGATVNAFDISEESLKKAEKYAAQHGVADRITFRKENAEALSYPDDTFDIVIGGAILHHLDIEKASCEIYRVLKKEGRALFLEPLGHNPFIRLYRKMTPHKRTPDEHPLLISHIRSLAAPFSKVECKYFYFLSVSANLILMLTKSTFLFRKTYNALERADEIFLNLFPFLRRYCWSVIIVLEK